jgi:hypothetical protein
MSRPVPVPAGFSFTRCGGVGGIQCGGFAGVGAASAHPGVLAADCGRQLLTQGPPHYKRSRIRSHFTTPYFPPHTSFSHRHQRRPRHIHRLHIYKQKSHDQLTRVELSKPLLQNDSIHKRAHTRVGADSSHGREASTRRMGCPQVRRYKCRQVPGEYSRHCQVRRRFDRRMSAEY